MNNTSSPIFVAIRSSIQPWRGAMLLLLLWLAVGCAAPPTPDAAPDAPTAPPATAAASATSAPPATATTEVPAPASTTTTPALASATATPASDSATPSSTGTAEANGSAVFMPIVSAPGATSTPTPPPPTATPAPTRTPGPTKTPEPPPTMDLRGDLPPMTLADWPRPAGDNGRCMHWLRDQYFTEEQLNTNLARLQQLGAKWVLVVYADENQIKMAAPRFAEAGIVPIWRKMLRPYEPYYNWERDVRLVESFGLPPYFQVYNEPSLGQEWTDGWEGAADEALFLDNLMQASRDLYNAGGYVGWQFVSPHWLDRAIDEVQQREGTKLFERFFFVPHAYGENLPPAWTEDGRGVLSYRQWADQIERRLGFRPMMIVGEGGWRINGQDEPRFPPMDDATHATYHVELFDWFRTGTVSDGQPLPDELLAYCPWLISARGDDNAWWDSFAGDREQTIAAVSAMPPFERRFSWER